jgi:putative protein-disulfide isomerase
MMTKPTLIYVYDPLCGWCYGFHPIMQKLEFRFEDQLNISVVPGGLAIGEDAQTIEDGYAYIKDSLSQVEKATGVSFGKNFRLLAEEGSYYYNSEPGCIAQTVVNSLAPSHSLDFAGKMQYALFNDGKSLNEPETFTDIISELGLSTDEFLDRYHSEEMQQKTRSGFQWVQDQNASAFPTLLLEIGNDTGLMSKGYRPYDTLESHLHHLLRNIERISR